MDNDFIPYNYHGNTIRIMRDKTDNKYWFVIVDALAIIYKNNADVFWDKIKQQTKNPSTLYSTLNTEHGTLDVADLQQMQQIINNIPNRKAKKTELWIWLKNPIPQQILNKINHALYDGKITDTERNDIINKAENIGVDIDYLNGYIDDAIIARQNYLAKQSFKQHRDISKPETKKEIDINDKEVVPWGCLASLIVISVALVSLLLKFDMREGAEIIIVSTIMLVFCFLVPSTSTKTNLDINNYSRILFRQGDYAKTTYQTKTNPKLQSLKDEIRHAIEHGMMTFEKWRYFENKAILKGIDKSIINAFIKRELKKWFSKLKATDLQRCPDCKEFIPFSTVQCPFCGLSLIWHKVKGLTMLALSDRVLTDVERDTIVTTAIKGGIKPNEINQYLSESLEQRLKSYTKVDLRDCPYCGAQIPLVSDECLYCGKPLEHIEGNIIEPFKISGPEANIILNENTRVEEERHNIKECPDCGAPFPLISNICPSCGHVLHERYENKLNIKNLLDNIMKSINRVNDAPKPKVHQILDYWIYYILLLLSVGIFITAIIFNSEVGKMMSLFGFGTSILLLMFAPQTIKDSYTPAQKADGEYYKARYAYEMYARQVEILYGDDPEAKPLLNKFAAAIKRLKRERYQNRQRVTLIIGMIGMLLLGVISFFSAPKEAESKKQTIISSTWEMPKNADSVLNFSKELKPYPTETGVDPSLTNYIKAGKGTDLTFVIDNKEAPTFHWKINKLELTTNSEIDSNNKFKTLSISIYLIDKDLKPIGTFNQSTENTIILNGKGNILVDFWSKYNTNNDVIIQTIMQRAEYYTIYSNSQL